MLPLDILFEEHRRHYEPGTLDRFLSWFERSGYGGMLANHWIRRGAGAAAPRPDSTPLSELRNLIYRNEGGAPWTVRFAPAIEEASDLRSLFDRLVRCTGHTHLSGDFRLYPAHFVEVYRGPRYILFDGAGTCLLLGAMIQSLASRLLNEPIDLHYSCSANRELTHVYGTWKDRMFVDPDQKTFVPLEQIDQSAVFGYLFQQLGVSAHQIYLALSDGERAELFSTMARDYFNFYAESTRQYMYQPRQSVDDVSRYFKQARERFVSDLSIDADDFAWKEQFRRAGEMRGVERPYFLVEAGRAVPIEIPDGGSLSIGYDNDGLPEEARILATIFLGRVPGALRTPLAEGRARVSVPELPWMIVFSRGVRRVGINGQFFDTSLSRCGKFAYVGMGGLDRIFHSSVGSGDYSLDIDAPDRSASIVLPFNAFALGSDLVRIDAPAGAGRSIVRLS